MSKVFISYSFKEPDSKIADQFTKALKREHDVFFASESIRLGDEWPEKINSALENCDYFILFLSERSMHSEMVTEEVRRAKKLRDIHPNKRPVILPVRINLPFDKDINYDLAGYLNRIEQRFWNSDDDTEKILNEIFEIISSNKDNSSDEIRERPKISDTDIPLPNAPLDLEIPEGKMSLQSAFYIERDGEQAFIKQILKPGALLRIKGSRQFGKTSLLSRILSFARDKKYQIISLSFQQFDEAAFCDSNMLMRQICAYASKSLKLPVRIDDYWKEELLGLKMKCSTYFEEYLLEKSDVDVVFAIDEADRLFKYKDVSSDFFSMLRVWHEDSMETPTLQRLHVVVTHSIEVNLSMEEVNQSPFGNVGNVLTLQEFSSRQVKDLVKRHRLLWDDNKVDQLMDIIGGYPFLVRKALYEIANNNMSFNDFIKQAATDDGLYGDHLRRHLAVLMRKPELLQEMKYILKNEHANDMLCYYRLMAGGLVKGDSSSVRPSFKLYKMYFDKRL